MHPIGRDHPWLTKAKLDALAIILIHYDTSNLSCFLTLAAKGEWACLLKWGTIYNV